VKIKICGLFRDEDIAYANEARPDYIGFVFAQSRRNISPVRAARLRRRLLDDIVSVGVFVNTPIGDIAALYHDGVISAAQLHGDEDDAYIVRLREAAGDEQKPILIIKTIKSAQLESGKTISSNSDYYLFDSGAGGGKTFNWDILNSQCRPPHTGEQESPRRRARDSPGKPWFLAGGIDLGNIEKAIALKPFALDISSGAETDGIKDRKKIIQLTTIVRKANTL
jgi:phosphoribosylanthranilate isomerase